MINILEMPSNIWSLQPTMSCRINKTKTTVSEYLADLNIKWLFKEDNKSDIHIRIFKEETGLIYPWKFVEELKKNVLLNPYIKLIGESREFAPAAYYFARPESALAVSPGNTFRRLFFASEWRDPKLDEWHDRMDRICWIARPTPERIKLATSLINDGIPLDIFSAEKWPNNNWKGYAKDELLTSEMYRYRLVSENSLDYGYHSEKLFNSIRCGCVTFYNCDPTLDIPGVNGAYIPLDAELMKYRSDISQDVIMNINNFMFSDAWEIYSFKQFYDRILSLVNELL